MAFQLQQLPVKKYFCVHCRDESTRLFAYSFDTLETVYGHWLSNHTELPVSRPFLFYFVEYVACNYCDYSGFYGRLRKHHANSHANELMMIKRQVDREKCALCHQTVPNILCLFDQSHQLILDDADIFNPVCFSRETLTELLAIDIHHKRVCGNCGASFETDHEANEHHYNMHSNKQKLVVKRNDEQSNRISYFICGLCGIEVRPQEYYAHVEMDQIIFPFSAGSSKWSYYNKLYKDYLKTKVVFGNRLVVFKQNLIDSEYDDSQQFADFISRIVARALE